MTAKVGSQIFIEHSNNEPGAISSTIARVTARQTWTVEAYANARLIAAAPDLLEAVQAFMDCAPSEGHRCLYCNASVYGTEDTDEHSPDCEIEKGRAAIEKARGITK